MANYQARLRMSSWVTTNNGERSPVRRPSPSRVRRPGEPRCRRLGDAAVPTKNPEQNPEQGVPPDRRGGIVSAGG